MRVDRGQLGWGVFLIVAGAVPLAVRAGALDPAILGRAPELWPLILIGVGLGLVLAGTRAAIVGGLVVALTLGLMAGALLSGAIGLMGSNGIVGVCGIGDDQGGTAFPSQGGALGGGGPVRITMDCGRLSVAQGGSGAWSLDGASPDGRPPRITEDGALVIRPAERSTVSIGTGASRWDLHLPAGTPLDLALTMNAGRATLQYAGLDVTGTQVTVNAGEARVDMGGMVLASEARSVDATVNAGSLAVQLSDGLVRGTITVNAGSASVCLPADGEILVHAAGSPLGANNFADRGLVKSGNDWSTPGYGSTANRAELTVHVNLGAITLDPENGCG